jgi:tRNA nucleotidyltransferase (CCA-adding enzyme)
MLHPDASNSALYAKLRSLSIETLLFIMAKARSDRARMAISTYITRLRPTKILLGGEDLKVLGFKAGPIYSKILRAVLDARLNDQVKTKQDEIDFVLRNFER